MCSTVSFSYAAKREYGLQLYSLRNEFGKQSVEDVVAKVAKAGYSFVEPYGYSKEKGFWGLSPKQFKQLLDKHKLKTYGGHYNFGFLEAGIDHEVIEDYIRVAKTLGQKYIIVPHIKRSIFDSEGEVREFIERLRVVSEIFRKAGLKLAYHNHDFEYKDLGGKTGYDIMLKELSASEMEFEIDLYWAVRAKQNIDALFKKHSGRFTKWHIKDIRKSDETKNTEIGNGTIDYKAILKHAKLAGMKYAIVEQENFEIDPFESIQKSINYLKSLE
ncbi:sugar phosphate isomerase/epimerase [Pseudoxanthomonas sp. SGD-10]|nr:sugar phosphate isomerase/epimerase [Pseudoxanthomonas sp. SGD-10]